MRFSVKFSAPVLGKAGLPGQFQCLNRRTARTGRISMWHDVDRNVRLLLALRWHPVSYFLDEPLLEFFARFDCSAAYDQRVRIERVDHLVEKQSQAVSLHTENLAAHRIAFF